MEQRAVCPVYHNTATRVTGRESYGKNGEQQGILQRLTRLSRPTISGPFVAAHKYWEDA